MKKQFSLGLILFLFAAFNALAALGSNTNSLISLSTNSLLWIEGDSTFHAFESQAKVIALNSSVSLDGGIAPATGAAFLNNVDQAPRISSLVLTIPIKDMKSKTRGLDSHLYKALKYKDFPDIVFNMTSYRIEKIKEGADHCDVTATGDLALAGKTNSITVAMTAAMEKEHLNVRGEHQLLMSDFGVPPPTLFLGTIRVADKIVIKWNLNITLTPTSKED